MRSYLFIGNKKCRIYAACGVSQTPIEIINLRGETTTVYKLVDGRYMDCTNTVYIYDGKDTWTDTNGVEWNQEVI